MTRPGGVVAACVWDHGGQRGPLRDFWAAARTVVPDVDDESELPGHTRATSRSCLRRRGCWGRVGGVDRDAAARVVRGVVGAVHARGRAGRGVCAGLGRGDTCRARGRVPPAPQPRGPFLLDGVAWAAAGWPRRTRRRPVADGPPPRWRRRERAAARRPRGRGSAPGRSLHPGSGSCRCPTTSRRRRSHLVAPSSGQSPWAPRPGRASPEESVPGVVSGAVVVPSSPVVGDAVAAGDSDGLGSAANATAEPPTTSRPIASSAMAIERLALLKAPPTAAGWWGWGPCRSPTAVSSRSRRSARPVAPSRPRSLRVG